MRCFIGTWVFNRLYHLATAISVAAFLAACDDSGVDRVLPERPSREFIEEGVTGRAVNGLYQVGDRLLATTDSGIYGKGIEQDRWQLVALENQLIVDLAIVDELLWLAAVADAGRNPNADPKLLATVNRGSNWQVVDNDFGGSEQSTEPIFALHYDEPGEGLFATGTASLAVSEDLGETWTLIDGAWNAIATGQDALNLNTDRDEIWYGGQNALEQMTLRRFDLAADTGEGFGRLLPSPSVIKDIVFRTQAEPALVFASGEGGILRSDDNGDSWTRPLGDVDFRFYYALAIDPQAPDTLYTAGWDKAAADAPQPLVLEVSRDAGQSFESFEYDAPRLRGGALSILAVVENGETVVYIGLDGGGIVKVLDPAAPADPA